MKKFALIAAAALVSTPALAQFQGPSVPAATVEHAKTLKDDANVTLKGNITQNLGGEKYVFQDATGTITVEIDNDKWNGQPVAPQDLVEIRGEVDKDWNSTEIDVEQITKVAQ